MRLAVASPLKAEVALGLRANAAQFALLVIVNAFVGAMVGLERAILPVLAESEFHLVARSAILSWNNPVSLGGILHKVRQVDAMPECCDEIDIPGRCSSYIKHPQRFLPTHAL